MLPFTENIGFWIVTVLLCAFGYLLALKYSKRRAANAPASAIRSPEQRWLHRASLLVLMLPILYVLAIDGRWFWGVFTVLWAHVALMVLTRGLTAQFYVRLAVAAVGSLLIGAAVSAWPALDIDGLRSAPWGFLIIAAAAVSASYALSRYAAPVAYRQRLW